MPKSQFHKCRRLSLAVGTVIAVLAGSATPWGAAQKSVRCANPTYEAQKFLQALYPERKKRGTPFCTASAELMILRGPICPG